MKNEKELVSVVIPTFKRPEKLLRALKSVICQTYQNIEIIIVDDNGKNSFKQQETESVIEKYYNEENLSYIVHKDNKGGAIARNTGIKRSKGNYISFLDDDDVFYPEKIELQIKCFHNSKFDNLGIVYCFEEVINMNGKKSYYKNKKIRGNALKEQLFSNIARTSTLLIEKNIFSDVGLFKELDAGQENELMLRIFANGYKIDYVDEILVKHYEHDGDRISCEENKIRAIKKIQKEKRKYYNILTKKEKDQLEQKYYRTLFRNSMKKNGRLSSLKLLKKTIISDISSSKNLNDILYFLLNDNIFNKFKELIKS